MRQAHTHHSDPVSSNIQLLDRIQWILTNREITQEQLCTQGGFANRTQVASVIHRLKVDPDYPSKMSLITYERLAKGGRVSLLWLVHGLGKPDQKVSALGNTMYPNLNIALNYEGSRWQESTIRAAMGMPWKSDRAPKDWTSMLDKLESDLAKFYAEHDLTPGE